MNKKNKTKSEDAVSSDYSFPVRPPCLKCGSRYVARIIGPRARVGDFEEKLRRKEFTLGTCFMTEKGEVWDCNECGYRFGSHSFIPLIMKPVSLHIEAQHQAWLHPEKIKDSIVLGCYHCLKTFTRWDIMEWIEDVSDTPEPLCPYCQQDAVIGDAHGFPITESLLREIRDHCYDKDEWWEDNDGRVQV